MAEHIIATSYWQVQSKQLKEREKNTATWMPI